MSLSNATIIEKGSFKSGSFNNAVINNWGLGVVEAGSIGSAASRPAQQRASYGDRSTTITAAKSGADDVFAATPTTGSWTANHAAIANRYIPGDGMYTAVRVNTSDIMLSWRDTPGTSPDFATAKYVVWTSGANTINVRTATLTPVVIPSGTLAVGDRIGLQRLGNVVTVVKQTADTGAYAVIYTFAEPSSGNLHCVISFDGAGSVQNPRLLGAHWKTDYSSSILVCDGNSIVAGVNQTTPWPSVLKSKVPFNVAGCSLSNLGVGGQTSADMETDGASQVDALFNPSKTDVLIAMEVSNSIYKGRTAQQAYEDYAAYCRSRMLRGFRVVGLTVFDRKQLSEANTDMRPAIKAVNALIMDGWFNFCTDLIDTRLNDRLNDSANINYFDNLKVHPNDLALAPFVDQCVTALTTANPSTAGVV